MLTILFDGTAYGMLLFVLACGLSVTLGLMNFINLAHGAFAMAGGYCTVVLVNRLGVPFVLGLPIAFVATALLGALFERTLYVHVYARSHLDQVLFTIGLVFMAVAATDYVMGSSPQFVQIPQALQGQFDVFGIGMSKYRLLIIAVCGVLTVALQSILTRTRFGSRLRAAVDDPRVARWSGITASPRAACAAAHRPSTDEARLPAPDASRRFAYNAMPSAPGTRLPAPFARNPVFGRARPCSTAVRAS